MSIQKSCNIIAKNDYSWIVESKKTGKWYYFDDVCCATEISKIDGEISGFVYPGVDDTSEFSVRLNNGEIIQIEWIGGDDDWVKNVEYGIEYDEDYDRECSVW